jgi:hypothetical protein
MGYPPPPWKANGFALGTIRLIPVEQARLFVPMDVEIVHVVPGRTLAAVCAAYYAPGSALVYNELIVSPAVTRRGGTVSAWISHMYVDNADSMVGGREIWGLPKEMAQFRWREDRRGVDIWRDGQGLCSLHSQRPFWLLPIPVIIPAFGVLNDALLSFIVAIVGRIGVAGIHLNVPTNSPFAALRLAENGLALSVRNMRFVARAPRVVAPLRSSTA